MIHFWIPRPYHSCQSTDIPGSYEGVPIGTIVSTINAPPQYAQYDAQGERVPVRYPPLVIRAGTVLPPNFPPVPLPGTPVDGVTPAIFKRPRLSPQVLKDYAHPPDVE